jgi:CRP-like cAMP-binding protein
VTIRIIPAPSELRAVIERTPLLQGLGSEDVEQLCRQAEWCAVSPGSSVYRQGDPGGHLYVLISGTVKIATRAPDGREHLHAVLNPAAQFGEVGVLDASPRTSEAVAQTPVVLVRFARDTLHSWLRERPRIAERLLSLLARRLRDSNRALSDQIFIDVPGRLAKQLLALANSIGEAEGPRTRVHHGLTQAQLAELIGASRETVNKTLRAFESRGWIQVGPRTVLICDRAALDRR